MFLESTLFLQKLKNFKNQGCPVLATQLRIIQVACYSRELTSCFWRLVREWKVQSRGVHRDFNDSARDSLASRPSSHEKHLENFFRILTLSVLAVCPGDLLATHFSRKKHVFCVSKTVFKTFSVFPSTFCDGSLSSPFLSQLKLTQTLHVTLYKLHFYTFSPPNFKKKVWVLISSPHISCFELYLCCCFVFRYGFVSIFEIVLVWIVEVLFFCKLVSVDRFIYYHVLVSLR